MTKQREISPIDESYPALLSGVAQLLAQARRASVRSVNAAMTVTCWEISRRIVEHEQSGEARTAYGEALIDRLATDLAARFGKGFSQTNLKQMREFFLAWPIRQMLSDELASARRCRPNLKKVRQCLTHCRPSGSRFHGRITFDCSPLRTAKSAPSTQGKP
jgi:hypothetical protein